MSNEKRKELRDFLISAGKPLPEVFDAGEMKVEIRTVSVGQRGIILQKAGALTGDPGKQDLGKLQAYATVYSAFHPETGEALFDETDVAMLEGCPTGSVLANLGEACMKRLNVESDRDAAKND